MAEHYTVVQPRSLEEIAKKEHISQGFLEEIAASLRSYGIVEGRRGAHGGYILAKPPETISVADVITAIEGPVALVECLGEEISCKLVARCGNKNVWNKIQKQLLFMLTNMTVAEVVSDYGSVNTLKLSSRV